MTSARRRVPFRVALVSLVVGAIGLSGAGLTALAWREAEAAAHAVMVVAVDEALASAAARTHELFQRAEAAVRQGPELAARGLIDATRPETVAAFVLAHLRAHPDLTWSCFGGADERFAGAWRDRMPGLMLNRSWPLANGKVHLEEDRLLADGRREIVRRSEDHGYFPTRRPFWTLARTAGGPVWTEPYGFYTQGLGITCAAPLPDPVTPSTMRGVFTVDLSFDTLAAFFSTLRPGVHGRTYLTSPTGALVAGMGVADAKCLQRAAAALRDHGAAASPCDAAGEPVQVRVQPIEAAGRAWLLAVVAEDRDFVGGARASLLRNLAWAGLAVLLALVLALWVARAIARPLTELAVVADRIGQGDWAVQVPVRGRDELGRLETALGGMVKALHDREFLRNALGRYVSSEVAERVASNPNALRLGGERRDITVLFSDLRGFSDLTERIGPEAMIGLLNRYFAAMVPVVLAHRGTIDELQGDAMLVLFGAPLQHDDDAARAVRCAVALQKALLALNVELVRDGLPELAMGIGLHSGAVVAGNIGSHDRAKYGVVGGTVNLAARIESLTEPGQVLASQDTLDLAGPEIATGQRRSVELKGIRSGIDVCEVLGIAGEEPLPPRASEGPLLPADLPASVRRLDGKRLVEWPDRRRHLHD
jgi:class 3 adenylate cyclase